MVVGGLQNLEELGEQFALGEARVEAERDVFQHRQRLEQREMLEHHADAEPGMEIGSYAICLVALILKNTPMRTWAGLLPPIFRDGCSCACSPIGSKPRHSGILDRAILRRLHEHRDEAFELRDARPFATRGPTTREGVGLKSGALLVRAWNGRLERVMILDDGCAWNGCVYRSLSLTRRNRPGPRSGRKPAGALLRRLNPFAGRRAAAKTALIDQRSKMAQRLLVETVATQDGSMRAARADAEDAADDLEVAKEALAMFEGARGECDDGLRRAERRVAQGRRLALWRQRRLYWKRARSWSSGP